jgi:hypothetical protein
MSLRHLVRSTLLRNIFSLIMVAMLLAACSVGGDEPDPEPTPMPTGVPPTEVPGALSVEAFTNRINTAWGGVTTLRVTSSSGAVPTESSSSTPSTQGTYTVEEWSSPNNRRITELIDGTVINEQVYVDETIYMRGLFVGSAVAPEVGSGTWIILDQSVVPADTPVGNRIRYLTREASAPFENMSPDVLPLPVTESGSIRVGERSCTLYTFGDPENTGDAIRYEVALDENDLPCQVVMRGGGFQNSSIYEINSGDLEIVAPLEGTPVSGTPEG